MASDASLSDISDEDLVDLIRGNNLRAVEEFVRRFRQLVKTATVRRAPDLLAHFEDILAGVVAETTLRYDRRLGSLRGYLVGAVMTAMQQTWSAYRPAGQPHRLPPYRQRRDAAGLDLTVLDDAPGEAVSAVSENWRRVVERRDARIDFDWLIARAPDLVARGLQVMRDRQATVAEAAAEIGTTRFTLQRRLNKFVSEVAAAYGDYADAA